MIWILVAIIAFIILIKIVSKIREGEDTSVWKNTHNENYKDFLDESFKNGDMEKWN